MYNGRNGFGYQPHKVEESTPPMDECLEHTNVETSRGHRFFKPPLASEIIDPKRWKESDKVWAAFYGDLFVGYNHEMKLRIHYQDECRKLEEENKFLLRCIKEQAR